MPASRFSPFLIPLLCFLVFSSLPLQAQDADSDQATTPAVLSEVATRLVDLDKAIAEQRSRADELVRQIAQTPDADEKAVLEKQLAEVRDRIGRLRKSIDQIVIGGIDTTDFSDRPPEKIDWRAELEQISLPLLASLRELTAKPRRIEALRAEIARAEDRLETIDKALASIANFSAAELPKPVEARVEAIENEWLARKTEVQQALELAVLQLNSLSGEDVPVWESVGESLSGFFKGRGLTLALAALASVATWLIIRALLKFYENVLVRGKGRARTTQIRVVEYAFRAVTFILVTAAAIIVFYLRNDVLLLALSIAAIVGVLLGLRQIVPRYVRETRLLLDIGPVREGERVMVDGVPYRVMSLNVESILKNPRLEGLLRLPLASLDGMVSRPERDEPWFPTRRGDYILTNDGMFAQVLSQSVELVQLKVRDSHVHYPTNVFLNLYARNLSTVGYGLVVTFGIDYEHQAIALDEPGPAFQSAIRAKIDEAGLGEHVTDIVVEFKEAGASSLDYLVVLSVAGSGAGSYFKLGRLVQQACVATCNDKGWVIPFGQLTIHPGKDFIEAGLLRGDSQS
jgi:hypothetical protein